MIGIRCIVAYRILDELRCGPAVVIRLAEKQGVSTRTVKRSIRLLRDLDAPIEKTQRGNEHLWTLWIQEWRIPFQSLTAQCKILELERVLAPGAETDLLECVLRLQQDNREMQARLIKEVA